MNEELRLYTFTLYQLSSIQQGIQAGHAAVELGMKAYNRQMRMRDGTWFTIYHRWATEWKTMVLLNGGDYAELREFADSLSSFDNPYPWESFEESEASLKGLLTSVAIILPARIFETAEQLRKNVFITKDYPDGFSDRELELIDKLSRTGLAR
jgi:hypothetical protein